MSDKKAAQALASALAREDKLGAVKVLWLRLWTACCRPKQGVTNQVRLFAKRQSAKKLVEHRANIIDMHSQSLYNDPIAVWKFVKPKAGIVPLNQAAPIDDELVELFNRELAAPNDNLERKFNLELDQALESHSYDLGFVVTTQNIRDAILKLKKKHSSGADQLCGMHLVHGSPSLIII
ncbi:hypothetical protein QYM36_011751 [Artemia franciscana]|uniref:Uncharacterized protein n=1 Tax=Artemia franciscana TaxID=6661 RepID=A0AA88HY98_ARTSF|nr:hypothetical protein QYM36_011751 [Artemia franciscana]